MNEGQFEKMAEALQKSIADEIAYTYSVFIANSTDNIVYKMNSNILLPDRKFLDTGLQNNVGNNLIFPYDVLKGKIEKQINVFYSEFSLSSKTLKELSHYGDRAGSFKKQFADNLEKSKTTTLDVVFRELDSQILQGRDAKSVISHMQNILSKRLNYLSRLLKESAGQMPQYMVLWDYQDKGYTRYRLRTNGDTCKDCTSLDGKIFAISEAESGKNFIPLHPNCDCSAEVLDEAGNAVFVIENDNADETEDEKSTDAFDYLATSLKQMFLGNFAEGSNLLGTLGQVALGLLGLDLPMDIRDLLYDITNFKLTPEHTFQTIMDIFALLPGVGAVKYTDEITDTLKLTAKYGDDAGGLIKDSKKIYNASKNIRPMTTKEAIEAAKALGFEPTGQFSHGQPIFKKANKYITPDIDGHIGGVWKMANSIKDLGSKRSRLGTYDKNLKRIGD